MHRGVDTVQEAKMTVKVESTMNSITSTARAFHRSFLYFSFTLSLDGDNDVVHVY